FSPTINVGSDSELTRFMKKSGYGIIYLIIFLFFISCSQPLVYKETRMFMGTIVSIEVVESSSRAATEIMNKVWDEAERLERVFSRYLPDSEISRINREAGKRPVPVSDEMLEVLIRAEEISRITEGAFDISVGPLMEIWGFFPDRKGEVPSEGELADVMARVGWRSIELDRSDQTVHFMKPGMDIDLAAIAKGFIVDQLVSLLVREGIESALVNAGGDIYCLGEYPGRGLWRIGVEHPREEGEVLTVLELKDRAVATSGDYRNYFIRKKKRYSHIIDPRTGEPSRSEVAGVSIMAQDCVTADGLATAMFVLGADRGISLLRRIEDVEGIIITEENGEIVVHYSAEDRG
ncbi:MAG: FAD:protein FMN transferase, partial [Candidatus Auribacterota bacterium]|nr:FAD:protein FMN transferase [Candidatus Auribacterota bacterium]